MGRKDWYERGTGNEKPNRFDEEEIAFALRFDRVKIDGND